LRNNTYVKIDLDILEENYRAICQKAGVPVMAIIKADAYGHGAVPIAHHLAHLCGYFGVSSVEEAIELRNAGIQQPILVLGHIPVSEFPQAVKLQIRPAICRYDDALALSQEAQRQNVTAPFHFALDTGMSRIGFQPTAEDAQLCARIAALPNLTAEGLFSHFASSDSTDLSEAREQAALFDSFDRMLRALGVEIPIRHMDNSAGIMNFSAHYEMVRAGIVLYGLYPSDEVDPKLLPLQPALSWYSYVSLIKELPAGRRIGYGGTHVLTRTTRVATIPAGYADGYRRGLSDRFCVLIRGKRAPILGRICMDQLMVDVTDIPQAQTDDKVVLIGTQDQEQITLEQMAQVLDTINYEVACGISRRVPRIYYRDNKYQEQIHYLLDRNNL